MKSLCLTDYDDNFDATDIMILLDNCCNRLESLEFQGGKSYTDVFILFILLKCSNSLKSLTVKDCDLVRSFAVIGKVPLTALKHLSLEDLNGVADSTLSSLLMNARGLETLSLQSLPLITDDAFLDRFHTQCTSTSTSTSFKSVEFGSISVTDQTLKCIAHCSNLEKIRVWDTESTTCGLIEVVRNCSKLTNIQFYDHVSLLTDSLICDVTVLPNLQVLFLDSLYSSITDESIIQLATKCPHLTLLELHPNCRGVTNKNLLAIASSCTYIETLSFGGHGRDITALAVANLYDKCKHLTVFGGVRSLIRRTTGTYRMLLDRQLAELVDDEYGEDYCYTDESAIDSEAESQDGYESV